MTFFRLAFLVLIIALASNIQAADGAGDAEKLARLTAVNAELTRKVQELTKAKADCDHILDQMLRAAKDD
jgi:hypothetical protein